MDDLENNNLLLRKHMLTRILQYLYIKVRVIFQVKSIF